MYLITAVVCILLLDFEHLRKLIMDALQQMQRFNQHGIVTLRRQHY